MKNFDPFELSDEMDLYDNLFHVASMTECTGLVPAAPASTADVESYGEIYDIPIDKVTSEETNNNLQSIQKQKD